MEHLTQRNFSFGAHDVIVACRNPPDSQSGLTLTWQIDSPAQHGSQSPDSIGLDVWPAAIALCRYLANHPDLIEAQDVVEIGAGTGLVGLLAAKLGARTVLLTDYEPMVLEQAQQSAAANGVEAQCRCLRLDWTNLSTVMPELRQSCRLLLAADVLYASLVAQPLADTLAALLHPEGVCVLGHQMRRAVVLDRQTRLPRLEDHDEPLEKFKAACQAAGMHVRTLSSRVTCSNVDTDPMLLLAVGWQHGRVEALPAV